MWWHPDQFETRSKNLKTRDAIIKKIRHYFDAQDFLEVQTPALQVMPSADTHIHAFEIGDLGLHTSPEIAMKKLLVAGAGDIYQICPVYRKNEDSPLHACEFTMLEWYRAGADYTAMMDDCQRLIKSFNIPKFKRGNIECDVTGTWEKLSVAEAFQQYADTDLHGDLKAAAQKLKIRTTPDDNWDDLFHAIMAEKIEPYLGRSVPTILYEYPISMAALARKSKDPRYAECFELYICGVELANAFSELTDADEQRKRLEADLALKHKLYGQSAAIDEDFLHALEYGMPESSGCALGVDRLIMLICGADNIQDVLWANKPHA